jgi:hypothetical protein
MITRGAKFRLSQEFRNEPFAQKSISCETLQLPIGRLNAAKDLLAVHADKLGVGRPTFQREFGRPELSRSL